MGGFGGRGSRARRYFGKNVVPPILSHPASPGPLTPDPLEETRIKTHRFDVMVTVLGVRLHSI